MKCNFLFPFEINFDVGNVIANVANFEDICKFGI